MNLTQIYKQYGIKGIAIRLFYSDLIRLFVLGGGPTAILAGLLCITGFMSDHFYTITFVSYFLIITIFGIDSNYSNLSKIGLDAYGNPIKDTSSE